MNKLTFNFSIPEDTELDLDSLEVQGSFIATKHISNDLVWYHGLFEIETPEWLEHWLHLSKSYDLLDALIEQLQTFGCQMTDMDHINYTDAQPVDQQVLFDLDEQAWLEMDRLIQCTTQIVYDESTVDTED